MKRGSKYIIDVNIWISVIITKKLFSFTNYILDKEIHIIISQELIEELSEVLNRPKFRKYELQNFKQYINFIEDLSEKVKPSKQFVGSPDSKDDYLFSLALSSNAILVTGDKKLLEFVESPIKIISLLEFKNEKLH